MVKRCKLSLFLAAEKGGVPGRQISPFFWKIVEREHHGHDANRNTSASNDAFYPIDIQHHFSVDCINDLILKYAINRAVIDTNGVFHGNASFSNNISHGAISESDLRCA